MFLEAIQRGYFALYWEPALPDVSTVNHGCQGAIGRYGPDYGHEEHQKDIARKYGILEPGFILCDELELHFTIQNRNGFDFLCRFAQEHGYDKPVLSTTRVKGRVIDAVQLKEALITNEQIKKHVNDLVYELSRLTTAEIDDDFEILTLVDTDPFYEWNTKEMYPISYTIIERDTERVRKIWFESNIMRDC